MFRVSGFKLSNGWLKNWIQETVYKVTKRVWYDSDGSGSDYRFFYFVDGKLTAIDQGERAVDYRLRID